MSQKKMSQKVAKQYASEATKQQVKNEVKKEFQKAGKKMGPSTRQEINKTVKSRLRTAEEFDKSIINAPNSKTGQAVQDFVVGSIIGGDHSTQSVKKNIVTPAYKRISSLKED